MKTFLVGVIFLVAFGFFNSVNAFSTELVTDEGDTATYKLIAEPPSESSAVQMRFYVNGGTVTSVQEGRDTLLMIGACENNAVFEENKVCAELAAAGGVIVDGESLVLVTVTKSGDEPITFEPAPDHAYLTTTNDVVSEDGTVLQRYTIASSDTDPIDTSTSTNNSSLSIYLLIGILIILIAVFVAILAFSNKKQGQDNL